MAHGKVDSLEDDGAVDRQQWKKRVSDIGASGSLTSSSIEVPITGQGIVCE